MPECHVLVRPKLLQPLQHSVYEQEAGGGAIVARACYDMSVMYVRECARARACVCVSVLCLLFVSVLCPCINKILNLIISIQLDNMI